jgi:hypothetical protein
MCEVAYKAIVELPLRELFPVVWLSLNQYLICIVLGFCKGDVLLSFLADRERKSQNIALAFVELFDSSLDPGRYLDLQTYAKLFGKQLKEFILVSHWNAFVDEVTGGIIIDEGIDISAAFNYVKVDLNFGLRVESLLFGFIA